MCNVHIFPRIRKFCRNESPNDHLYISINISHKCLEILKFNFLKYHTVCNIKIVFYQINFVDNYGSVFVSDFR